MIELGEFEYCVAFTRTDLEHYTEKEMMSDFIGCFTDEIYEMKWGEKVMALKALYKPRITRQCAIAQQMESGVLDYVIVPDKHPSANLEFWTLDWSKR
jgi:hypothetical protein